MVMVNGASVATWTNSIGTDAINGTAANQPTYNTNVKNGKPTVRSTSTKWLTNSFASVSQPFTFVMVFRYNDGTANNETMIGGTNSVDFEFANRLSGPTWGAYAGNGSNFVNFGTSDNNWHAVILEINGASSKYAFDGAADSTMIQSPGPNAINSLSIGRDRTGGNPANVDFGEIIVRSGTYSATDKANCFLYLNSRWAIY